MKIHFRELKDNLGQKWTTVCHKYLSSHIVLKHTSNMQLSLKLGQNERKLNNQHQSRTMCVCIATVQKTGMDIAPLLDAYTHSDTHILVWMCTHR